MIDEGGIQFPEDDELINEFLDYVAYFGFPGGVGLEFDTRISTLEREEAERVVREFIKFAKNEPPDEDYMDDLLWGRVDPDDKTPTG